MQVTDRNPWDREEKEDDAAWALFARWRDLALPRPTPSAFCREVGRPNCSWPKTFFWEARAHAWDRYLDSRKQEIAVTETQEMARRHLSLMRRWLDVAEKQISIAEESTASRSAVWRPTDITRALKEAVLLERLSRGEVTERVSGGTDYSSLSDADLETLAEIQRKAKSKKV